MRASRRIVLAVEASQGFFSEAERQTFGRSLGNDESEWAARAQQKIDEVVEGVTLPLCHHSLQLCNELLQFHINLASKR